MTNFTKTGQIYYLQESQVNLRGIANEKLKSKENKPKK